MLLHSIWVRTVWHVFDMLKYQKWTTISVEIQSTNERYGIINVIHRLLILTIII